MPLVLLLHSSFTVETADHAQLMEVGIETRESAKKRTTMIVTGIAFPLNGFYFLHRNFNYIVDFHFSFSKVC